MTRFHPLCFLDPLKSHRCLLIIGILVGMALGPVARASQDEQSYPDGVAYPDGEAYPEEPVVSIPTPVHQGPPLSGEQVFQTVCIACHFPPTGLGGAPGLGNAEAWAPHIAKGMDTLFDHALHGFSGNGSSIMPRKGGRDDLSDEEIINTVKYMVGKVAPGMISGKQ